MATGKTGRIVWHDLFAPDLQTPKDFYGQVAGWQFMTEHATDFAWGGGAQDYVLALYGEEAGAGIIDRAPEGVSGWVPYIETSDVDEAADLTEELGGNIVKPPFEVPSVGRNCLLRDPCGAHVGVSQSRHNFPAPSVQFGAERYLAEPSGFPAAFYRELFGWDATPEIDVTARRQVITRSGDVVAVLAGQAADRPGGARWAPSVRVDRVPEALDAFRALRGDVLDPKAHSDKDGDGVLVRDRTGASFYLIAR